MHIFSTGHRMRLLFASCWLWAVCSPALAVPGDWERIGQAGDWKDTTAGTLFNGRLYTVEKSGALYVTERATQCVTCLFGRPTTASYHGQPLLRTSTG